MKPILEFLSGQPALVALVGAAITGALLFGLREIPGRCLALAREWFSVQVLIESDQEIYGHVNFWLARHQATRRARRLMLQQAYDYDARRWEWAITLGPGWHLLRYAGRFVLVDREVQETSALDKMVGPARRERLRLTTLGGDQSAVRALLAEAKALYEGDGLVKVFYWRGGGYALADRRSPRSLDTVFMPASQKARIIERLTRFLGDQAEYLRLGVPWRLGLLFEGPPGTGKTSLIFTLAGFIGRSVYLINLNNIQGDNDLTAAFNDVSHDGVVVIEDIDTATISHDRDGESRPVQAFADALGKLAPEAPSSVGGKLSLSGLLNAIDGLASMEGRILFITSNHAGKLDPALLRPGRVDVREVVDRLDGDVAWAMFRAFRPEGSRSEFESLIGGRLPIAPAELQNLLLADDRGGVLTALPTATARP